MFVVTRQRHDSLVLTLPNEIVTQPFLVVKILDVLPGGIKMGVEAPREVGLDRHEVFLNKTREQHVPVPDHILQLLQTHGR